MIKIKKKILIVEDEWISAEDIKEQLISANYEVVATVATGLDAIDRATKFHPDLVLMDITLSGNMTGAEAAVVIHSYMKIPVVFLTAYSFDAMKSDIINSNPYGYITKPYDEAELIKTVELALIKKQNELEIEQIVQKEMQDIKDELKKAQNQLEFQAENPNSNLSQIEEKIVSDISIDINHTDRNLYLKEIFEEFGNYDRFIIVDSLRSNPRTITELEIILQKNPATIYHHIRRLEQKNIIKGTKQGKNTVYSLVKDNFIKFYEYWQNMTEELENWYGKLDISVKEK